jgi:hypothetical protein
MQLDVPYLGLSSCISRDDDTTFCSLANRTSSEDLMFCPNKIELNEFLQVAEKSWTPRDRNEDLDELHKYRYDSICRFLAPSDDDNVYDRLVEGSKSEYAAYGPKRIIFRLSKNTTINNKTDDDKFDLEKVFPKTFSILNKNNETFHWFQYKNNILRVLVGRGVGQYHRDFESRQILRTWKRKIQLIP